ITARFDQNRAGAPFLEIVSKGAGLKSIIIFTHMSGYLILQNTIHSYYDLHGLFPDLINVLSFIISRCEYRNGGRLAASLSIIVNLLIVEVKAKSGLKRLSGGF